MTNRFLISVAAAALIAGTGFANAQGAGGMKNEGGAAQQSAPSSGGGAATQHKDDMKSGQHEKAPGAGKEAQDTKGKEKSGTVGQAPEKGGKDMKAQNREDMKGGMKGEGREKNGTVGQAPEKGGAATKGHEDKSGSTMGREDKMGQKGEKGSTDTKGAQQNQGTMDQNRAQTNQSGSQTSTTGQAGAGAKLSTEQQTKISTAIKSVHVAPTTNVNFSIAVGSRVPRSGVEFHTLPQQVVTVYPQWRGFKFILVKEEIVIIDPNTYEIVAVIPA